MSCSSLFNSTSQKVQFSRFTSLSANVNQKIVNTSDLKKSKTDFTINILFRNPTIHKYHLIYSCMWLLLSVQWDCHHAVIAVSVMPDSDEHENDIYEDEEVELSDDDPPAPTVGTFN